MVSDVSLKTGIWDHLNGAVIYLRLKEAGMSADLRKAIEEDPEVAQYIVQAGHDHLRNSHAS